jgi:malonate-semialdehyde dehydrogenase (acetylating) / methylmalonate-semialdehyde dehydrogenase
MSSVSPLPRCPFFIGGEWSQVSGLPVSPVFNPSTGEMIAEVQLGGAAEGEGGG